MNDSFHGLSILTDDQIQYYWQKYKGFAVQGFTLTLVNVSMTITVHKLLLQRKEYAVIRGLASVDTITGLGALTSGVGRMLLLSFGDVNTAVSRRWCLLMPWSWLFMLKPHINGLMLTMVSLDRFWAIAFPLSSFTRTTKQTYFLVLLPYLHAIIPLIYLSIDSFKSTEKNQRPFCFRTAYMGDWKYYSYAEPVFSTFSVLLYFSTIILLCKTKPPTGMNDQSMKDQLKFQRKFTLTLGLTAVSTFLFETFVRAVMALRVYLGGQEYLRKIDVIGPFMYNINKYQYLIRNLNPLLNIFIYTLRIRDIRIGMIRMFTCKKLTQNDLDNLNNDNRRSRAGSRVTPK